MTLATRHAALARVTEVSSHAVNLTENALLRALAALTVREWYYSLDHRRLQEEVGSNCLLLAILIHEKRVGPGRYQEPSRSSSPAVYGELDLREEREVEVEGAEMIKFFLPDAQAWPRILRERE